MVVVQSSVVGKHYSTYYVVDGTVDGAVAVL